MSLKSIANILKKNLKNSLPKEEIVAGKELLNAERCTLLTQSGVKFEFVIEQEPDAENIICSLELIDEELKPDIDNKSGEWNRYTYA